MSQYVVSSMSGEFDKELFVMKDSGRARNHGVEGGTLKQHRGLKGDGMLKVDWRLKGDHDSGDGTPNFSKDEDNANNIDVDFGLRMVRY